MKDRQTIQFFVLILSSLVFNNSSLVNAALSLKLWIYEDKKTIKLLLL